MGINGSYNLPFLRTKKHEIIAHMGINGSYNYNYNLDQCLAIIAHMGINGSYNSRAATAMKQEL